MEIINYEGKYINILGTVNTPYFIGSEIGKILGFSQPHNAIWTHVWNENKITYADLGVLRLATPLNSSRLASY